MQKIPKFLLRTMQSETKSKMLEDNLNWNILFFFCIVYFTFCHSVANRITKKDMVFRLTYTKYILLN